MSPERKKIFSELIKDNYITFRQELVQSVKKHKELIASRYLKPGIDENYLAYFYPSCKAEQERFLEWVRYGDMNKTVYELLDSITPRQKFVIVHIFGIDKSMEYDFKKIGRILGVSRERIRQIEVKAIKCLRIRMRQLFKRNPYCYEIFKKSAQDDEDYLVSIFSE